MLKKIFQLIFAAAFVNFCAAFDFNDYYTAHDQMDFPESMTRGDAAFLPINRFNPSNRFEMSPLLLPTSMFDTDRYFRYNDLSNMDPLNVRRQSEIINVLLGLPRGLEEAG
ncbi:unnamed protein product [Chironomus riparius]|uniref:Uncharacterized protein n=1 Tax=Chironomus riparius TaxID=315576 RepID=A0A9N9RV64_9DIPT|nr:unnamed protein product [Chironomus riparius]